MKFLHGGALAAIVMACSSAALTANAAAAEGSAQSASRCGALPPLPVVPDGAKADRKEVLAANEAVNACSKAAQPTLDYRRAEIQELTARTNALTNEYNAAIQQADSLVKSYEAEATKFNAR